MTEYVAFTQKDGEFTIEFENGIIKRGTAEQSYALHNLLCFGRDDKNLSAEPLKRLGWAGDILYERTFFSTAWKNYIASNFTQNNVSLMINEFNKSCARDYESGLIDKKIKMTEIYKIDRDTMKIILSFDSASQEIIINI